jgi:hypothetical protein
MRQSTISSLIFLCECSFEPLIWKPFLLPWQLLRSSHLSMMEQPGYHCFALWSRVWIWPNVIDHRLHCLHMQLCAVQCSCYFLGPKKKLFILVSYFNASLTVLYQPGICVSETVTADCICRTFARMRNGHGSQGITRYRLNQLGSPSVHTFKFSLLLWGTRVCRRRSS